MKEENNELLAIADAIRLRMAELGTTLSTAESCTSGRIASALTSVSGASAYFQGGLVAYQDRVKVQRLGVSQADIDRYDVVSRQVVEQMVRGACALFDTDYAMASTGYADKGNGVIPDGTIWIAWGTATQVESLCLHCQADRLTNTQLAVATVMRRFLDSIR